MNVSANHSLYAFCQGSARLVIIGIGNPLRGDDGLGWAIAEQLVRDGEDYDIHTVHQLTPELAQLMAAADLVVMIDASNEGEPGELRIRSVSPSTQASAVGTHHCTPEELVALTAAIYGHCPPVLVVTLTGVDFGISEQLSPTVSSRISLVCEVVNRQKKHSIDTLTVQQPYATRQPPSPTEWQLE